MRKTLLLTEFVATKALGDVQKLLEASLRLLKEDKALFESIHDYATDETYRTHALKTIAKLKLLSDRHSDERELGMKSLILALKGIRDYFSARGDSAFAEVISTNIQSAEKALITPGIVFEPKFSSGASPEDEAKLKSRFLSAATVNPKSFFPTPEMA